MGLDIEDTQDGGATKGGALRLSSNPDGDATASGDRLGVVEFAGTETAFEAMIVGAKIEAVATETWDATNNGANLNFYTTPGNNDATQRMTILSTGNVGIGTSSPDHKLEVAGINAAAQLDITTYDSDATYSVLEFRKSDSETEALAQTDDGDAIGQIRFKGVDTGGNLDSGAHIYVEQSGSAGTRVPTLMKLETYSSSAQNTNQLVLAANGNVGIGTASPSGTLDVAGAPGKITLVKTDEDAIDNNDLLGFLYFAGSEDGGATVLTGASIQARAADNTGGWQSGRLGTDLEFWTAPIDGTVLQRMTILDSGNVGIGTASPQGMLHVEGADDTVATVIIEVDGTHASNDYPALRLLRSKDAGLVADNDVLGMMQFMGYIGSNGDYYTNYELGAAITARVNGTPSNADEDIPTDLEFWTTPESTTSITQRMTITADGKVGIGTASPDGPMHLYYSNSTDVKTLIENNNADAIGLQIENVNGTGSAGASIHLKSSSADAYIVHEYTSADTGKLHFHMDNKTSALVIDNDGKVGIGTTSPGQMLEISAGGSAYIEITADDDGASTNNAGIVLSEYTTLMWYIRNAGGSANRLELVDASLDGAYLTQNETSAWDWSSDINLKTDISVIPDALSKINQIRGVNYKWKKYKSGASNILPIVDAETGLTVKGEQGWTDEHWEEMRSIRDINRIGVIAQEVNEVMPEAVNTDIDGEWTVKRGLLIPLLIEAVKELSAKVTALENA